MAPFWATCPKLACKYLTNKELFFGKRLLGRDAQECEKPLSLNCAIS
jgi:hypothetical protein